MLILALLLLAAPPDVSNTYRVEAPRVVKVKKGEAATAKVAVVPRSDAHVSPDAPISLTMSAGSAVTLPKAKLGRPEAKETAAKGVEFDVPFTAQASDQLKGSLVFFICTEKLCERQKRDVSVAVEVE
ncbi:MAG: hypothetical protein ACXWLM_00565 [Myxococcales bacterium]